MKNKIILSKSFSMDAVDYANQGNSLIGIRGSGKTFCAGVIAEQLLDAGIPIIAFDPTGVWQNLRNGIDGHPGYPVVVAGGMFADIPLTETNAVQIVDAALKAGVSLVLDLKGMSTSNKSSWMRIVSASVEFLMGNNHLYGLRHVFIEEAAEFVPQKPNPGGQMVYSRIESLARMGRNFGLGYTLINQRAEEIAKAIFEISEQVFVFRQAGKNSLKSIKDWLDYKGLKGHDITQTLPSLDNGQCWIIDGNKEVKVNIPKKKTFHPDPKVNKTSLPAGTKTADRTKFIETMKLAIEKKEVIKPKEEKKNIPTVSEIVRPSQVEEIRVLKNKNLSQAKTIVELQAYIRSVDQKMKKICDISKGTISADITGPDQSFAGTDKKTALTVRKHASPDNNMHKSVDNSIYTPSDIKIGACHKAILTFLAQHADRSFSKAQLGVITNYSPGSGGFNNSLSALTTLGAISRNNGKISLAGDVTDLIGKVEHKEYSYVQTKEEYDKELQNIIDMPPEEYPF